jgi:PAS domain-containing protein
VAIAVTRGPDHVFVYANQRYKSLIQPLRGEVIGRPLAEVHGDRVNPAIRHQRDAVFREGRAHTMRAVSFFLEGMVRRTLWDLTLIPVGDGTGAVKGLVAVGTEVTEQVEAARLAEARAAEARQAAEAAAYERERLSLAVEATKLGIWEWDVASNTVYWSPRQKEIFGLPPDATVTYEHWSTAIHPTTRTGSCRPSPSSSTRARRASWHSPIASSCQAARSGGSGRAGACCMRIATGRGQR